MFRPFDVKAPRPVGALGAVEKVEASNLKANSAPQGTTIAQRRADSICLAIAVPVFRASYNLEELRQYHAARGHRVREVAARVALVALRLVWRVLP